jgi:hypothetical protein
VTGSNASSATIVRIRSSVDAERAALIPLAAATRVSRAPFSARCSAVLDQLALVAVGEAHQGDLERDPLDVLGLVVALARRLSPSHHMK